jgi:arylsulfatase A
MNLKLHLTALLALLALFCNQLSAAEKPNIIVVLVDDLGIGDVSCYNPASKIPTPHFDALAKQGMRFTDAHSAASICSPTRYSLMTGRYPWRSTWRIGVLQAGDPCLITPGTPTLPGMLQSAGYRTAIVGKWHVGESPKFGLKEVGFDEVLPMGLKGDKVERFRENDGVVLSRTVEYLKARAEDKAGKPFFLYVCPTSPHDPYVPLKEWKGKSKAGDYGDEVLQLDAHLGEIMRVLDETGLANDTLLVVTSDNGPESAKRDYSLPKFDIPEDIDDRITVFERKEKFGHDSAGGWRGSKYSAYEGGHRVPFIVRWPGKVAAGAVNDTLQCQTDLFATCAAVAGATAQADDSVNQLPVWVGETKTPVRKNGVFASGLNKQVAVRRGDWVLITPLVPTGKKQANELYNLQDDPAQKTDLANKNPKLVAELRALFEKERTRSKE